MILVQGGICGKNQWGDKYKNCRKIDEKLRKNRGKIEFSPTIGETIPLFSPYKYHPVLVLYITNVKIRFYVLFSTVETELADPICKFTKMHALPE